MMAYLGKTLFSMPLLLLQYERGRLDFLDFRYDHWTGLIVICLYHDRVISVQIFPAGTLHYECTNTLHGHLPFCALLQPLLWRQRPRRRRTIKRSCNIHLPLEGNAWKTKTNKQATNKRNNKPNPLYRGTDHRRDRHMDGESTTT